MKHKTITGKTITGTDILFDLSRLFDLLCLEPWRYPTPIVTIPLRAVDEIKQLRQQLLAAETRVEQLGGTNG